MNENIFIRHVFGNVMRVAIPLTIRVRTLSDGVETETEENFYPNISLPTEVVLMRDGGVSKKYIPTVDGNVVTFEDDGTLRAGKYQITITCFDENGQPYRYMARNVIQVVLATKDAGIESGIEFDTKDYVLDGSVFFYAKGEDGVGVSSVEQIVSSKESGGINVVRITLSNGQTYDFETRNGESIHGMVLGTTLYI